MIFRFRKVLQEFEAHFHPTQAGSKMRGKSEWKQYADGTYRFKLSLSEIPLADGVHVDLWREGQWIMRLPVYNRKAKVDIENEGVSGIPSIQTGQTLQVRSGDNVLAEGTYEAE